MSIRHAYLHGFASSSLSTKGVAMRRHYAGKPEGTPELHTPDLNWPSFAELTYTGMLAAFDAFDRQLDEREQVEPGSARWRLIGSSMGGWVASRWAQLHPERVDRLLLLCPAFDFTTRWPVLIGEQAFARWREQGSIPLADGTKQIVDVHYELFLDAARQPARPVASCPTKIVHGTRDDIVPIASSREYAAAHANVELIEVDDDHLLMRSLATIERIVDEFLLGPDERTLWWDYFGPTAAGTAQHFRVHLDEFLAREQLTGCTTGVEVHPEHRHAAAWCRAPHDRVETLVRALKPRRVE
ncbi:alpha/beta fold hydrolase [Nannocystaceae bacterium ST9]